MDSLPLPAPCALPWAESPPVGLPRLLPRQWVFLGLCFQSVRPMDAYRQAYNPAASDNVAAAASSRLLAKGPVRDYLDTFKAEAFHLVRQTYLQALQATRPHYRKDDGGACVKVGESPDWKCRLQAADALARLHGL